MIILLSKSKVVHATIYYIYFSQTQGIYKMKGEYDRERVEDAAQKIFLQMDKNKDGELSEQEFITGAQNCKSIMKMLQGQ